MHCANFPRHFGRLITHCLIAHPEGADTIELAHWAYGEVLPRYARHNVRRHCLSFGIPRVGKRSSGSFGRCGRRRVSRTNCPKMGHAARAVWWSSHSVVTAVRINAPNDEES